MLDERLLKTIECLLTLAQVLPEDGVGVSRMLEATAELFYIIRRREDQLEVSFAMLLFFKVSKHLDVFGRERLEALKEGRKRDLLLASRLNLDAAFVR